MLPHPLEFGIERRDSRLSSTRMDEAIRGNSIEITAIWLLQWIDNTKYRTETTSRLPVHASADGDGSSYKLLSDGTGAVCMPTILWLAVQVQELQFGELRCSAAKGHLMPVLSRLKARKHENRSELNGL